MSVCRWKIAYVQGEMVKKGDKERKIEILMEDISLLEEHIQDLFTFTPIGIILVSPKGVTLEANPAMERITRKSIYDLAGAPVGKILPEEMFVETVEKGSVSGARTFVKGVEGKEIPVSLFSKERSDREGNATGYFFAIMDMTEIERMNDKIKESKDILEIKVAARTKELQELAESLESQIEERTVELREKLEELEKMNKLMVGREIKMIEMKDRLAQAEKKLKENR